MSQNEAWGFLGSDNFSLDDQIDGTISPVYVEGELLPKVNGRLLRPLKVWSYLHFSDGEDPDRAEVHHKGYSVEYIRREVRKELADNCSPLYGLKAGDLIHLVFPEEENEGCKSYPLFLIVIVAELARLGFRIEVNVLSQENAVLNETDRF